MVEESAAAGGQFNPMHATLQQRDADFMLQVTDLPAQRRLRRVQPLLRRELHAPRLGDCDEAAEVSEFHGAFYIP
jgi:hypothetical protein